MGTVILNGTPINITGTVTERAINPWTPRITQGPKDIGSYAACETIEYSDLRGGFGIEKESERGDRFFYSSMETEKNGFICSNPSPVTASASINITNKLFYEFNGNVFLLGNAVCYYDAGSTVYASCDASALANPTDVITVKDTTDSYMVVCNNTSARYLSGTGTVLYAGETAWTDASGGDVTCTADTTIYKVGSASAKMVVAGTAGVESIAYFNVSANLTAATHISLWLYSTVALAASDWEFVVDEDAALGMTGTHEHLALPAIAANTWTKVILTIGTPADLDSVDSIGLRQLVDKGAMTIYVDKVCAIAWATLSTSDIKYLAAFDKRLIGVDETGSNLFYSAQNNIDDAAGGAMSSFSLTGPWEKTYDLFTGLMPVTSAPMIFMFTDRGLVAVNFYTQQCELMDVRFNPPPSGVPMVGMYYNGEIYISHGTGIKKIAASGIVTEWGPDQDDGLDSDLKGNIQALTHSNNHVIIIVVGTTSNAVLKRHNTVGGWHSLGKPGGATFGYLVSMLSSTPRFYFAADGNYTVKYIPFIDTVQDISGTSSNAFSSGTIIYFPKFAPVEPIPKIALRVKAITENCDANNYFTISHKINDATSWTSLGTFVTSPYPTALEFGSGAGSAFYNIRFKLEVTIATPYTTSPVLKSLLFEYVTNPGYIGQWSFNIASTGQDVKRIYDALTTARDATTLVKFVPTGHEDDGYYWVKINQMPSKFDAYYRSPNRNLTVVVSEVY